MIRSFFLSQTNPLLSPPLLNFLIKQNFKKINPPFLYYFQNGKNKKVVTKNKNKNKNNKCKCLTPHY